MMFDRFWGLWNGNASHAIIRFSSIITSTVYPHSLRFAGLFLRPADAPESLLLPFWFFLSERLNWGLRPLHDITVLFYSVITYTLFTIEVSTYVILSLFLSFLISHCFPIKLKLIFHLHTYFTYRVFNVIRFGPDEALMFFVLYTHRRGAEAARGAHNSEVARSKRVAGILHSQVYKNLPRCQYSYAVIAMRR